MALALAARCALPWRLPAAAGLATAAGVTEPLRLNTIPRPASMKKGRRVGRGIGSGRGKTAGRGHKGQLARPGSGKPGPWFEGGQTPIYRRIPKVGFSNKPFQRELVPINLGTIQGWIDAGRIDPNEKITIKTLKDVGLVRHVKDGVKLLSKGYSSFTSKVDIELTHASRSAIERVEHLGGRFTARYYNRLGLRMLLLPEKFPNGLHKFALPPPKLLPFYKDPENRGYLAPEKLAEQ